MSWLVLRRARERCCAARVGTRGGVARAGPAAVLPLAQPDAERLDPEEPPTRPTLPRYPPPAFPGQRLGPVCLQDRTAQPFPKTRAVMPKPKRKLASPSPAV